MIGSRSGSQTRLVGSVVGSASDDEGIGGIPGVSRDSGSRIYVPANSTEWTKLMTAAGLATGNPSLLWLCQEASGSLSDSIGTFTGTASGATFTYQTALPGWSRLGIQLSNGGTNQMANVDAGLPDTLTASVLLLGYINAIASGGARDFANAGTTTQTRARMSNGTNLPIAVSGANSAAGASTINGVVRPIVLRHDRTAGTCTGFTDLEKVPTTFDATVTGKSIKLGDATARSPNFVCGYFAAFFNAAAELTNAQVKTLLQTLGWTIPWT